jgi:hypothetical protein
MAVNKLVVITFVTKLQVAKKVTRNVVWIAVILSATYWTDSRSMTV